MIIEIAALLNTDLQNAWETYTLPEHITQWNFADASWHCPHAVNDLRVNGLYKARMEARDGSVGFDFEAVYTDLEVGVGFTYVMTDGRKVEVTFAEKSEKVHIKVAFEAEQIHAPELQKQGWQQILDNYKKYAEIIR
jgi:uncharacterized protein YndB with AHSA1/START domain